MPKLPDRRDILLSGLVTPVPTKTAFVSGAGAPDPIGAWRSAPRSGADQPTPQDFGAKADGKSDDSAAFQRAIDTVMAGTAWPSGPNSGDKAFVRLPAGRYRVTQSLNFTSRTGVMNVGIRGDGCLNSVIFADLSDNYPVIDATGISYGQFDGFHVRSTKNSAATCAMLLAHAIDSEWHNRQTSLSNVRLVVDVNNFRALSGLVVQNADLIRSTNLICEGPVGVYAGSQLPSLGIFEAAKIVGRSIYLRDKVLVNGVNYVGLPVYVFGSGGGVNAEIESVSVADQGVVVKFDPGVTIDQFSHLKIFAVKSLYQRIGFKPDQTSYWIKQSEFYGKRPFVFTGGVNLSLDDVYLSANNGLDDVRTALHIEADGFQTTPVTIRGRNLRVENQTESTSFWAVTADKDILNMDISGELNIVNRHFQQPDQDSSVIRTRNSSSISNLRLSGLSILQAPLLNVAGSIRTLEGAFRADGGPGNVVGSLGVVRFDWGNDSLTPAWSHFLSSKKAQIADGMAPYWKMTFDDVMQQLADGRYLRRHAGGFRLDKVRGAKVLISASLSGPCEMWLSVDTECGRAHETSPVELKPGALTLEISAQYEGDTLGTSSELKRFEPSLRDHFVFNTRASLGAVSESAMLNVHIRSDEPDAFRVVTAKQV